MEIGDASGFGEMGGEEKRRNWYARFSPTGPAPTTRTSKSISGVPEPDILYTKVATL